MSAKNISLPAMILSLFAGVASVSCSLHGGVRSIDQDIPVATVKQSDVQLQVNTTGELRSTRTAAAIAPPVAGDTLQIIHLAKTGMSVKAGDVVVAFDPTEQEYKLAQNRSDFDQAGQEIVKAKDNAAVQVAQDQTALLKARFAVRQAELDVSKNDILSAIDGKKNLLTLEEAKRALAQLEQDIQSHTASNEASIAVATEKRNKAQLAITQARTNIENMEVHSPLDGLVVVRENRSGDFFGGMAVPTFQEGDQVWAGSVVAEVIDIGQMEVSAKVKESDRPSVAAGQSVELHIDALPGETFHAKVRSVAGMVANPWFDDPAHNFDVSAVMDRPDSRLRPGLAAHVVIFGDNLQRALSIPRQAIFNTDGKPKVYVRSGSGFESRDVKVRYLTEGLAVIEGLKEGTQVALVNPEQRSGEQSKPSGTAGPALGAGAP
jgi:HlyD family secretion protein